MAVIRSECEAGESLYRCPVCRLHVRVIPRLSQKPTWDLEGALPIIKVGRFCIRS
jgi:hypothetical protein